MENLSLYLVLLLALVSFIILKRRAIVKNLPPSPPGLPVIGHVHLILNNPLHLALTSLSSRYGPIYSLRLGCKSYVVVSSPSAIEECFTKNDIVLANRPKTVAGDCLTYNYSVIAWAPYGHLWRILRRVSVVEMFSSHSLQKSSHLREQEIAGLVRGLYKNGSRQKLDFNYLASIYSFNIAMKNISGKPLVGEDDVWTQVGKEKLQHIREFFSVGLTQNLCDFFPVLRWIGYKGIEKNLMLLFNKRDDYMQRMIDQIRGGSSNNIPVEQNHRNLIETLLSLQSSEPEFYTEDIIKSFIAVVLIAGTETSTTTTEWAMSLLLSHPEEMSKLRQEIDANVGHDHLINDSDIDKLPYLRCIINETLRLYPPAPLLLPHYASEECSIGGYTIPKDTTVLANAWGVHRDPEVWEDPEKFKPERFLNMELGHQFVPFGMGRRTCPGSAMALRTISLALGAFVQCFNWEKVVEEEDLTVNFKTRLTMKKSKPLQVMCSPRGLLINAL